MRRPTPTRRDLLAGLGLSAAVAPFVPYLDRFAEAATAAPRRLLLTFAPNGTIESRFWPTGGEETFTFPTGCITEPLAPFRRSLIFARNLKRARPPRSGPHEGPMASLWTGSTLDAAGLPRNGSIDQLIAAKLPRETAFASLEASVHHDEKEGANQSEITKHMCYTTAGKPVPPESNPYTLFARLMLTPSNAGGGGGVTADDLARVRAQNQSVIDLVNAELGDLSAKVGRGDRAKIDGHVSALRDLERQLQASSPAPGGAMGAGPAACTPPTLDAAYKTMADSAAAFPQLLKLQSDVMVAALACDRTRVASLQWSRTFSMLQHTWLGLTDPHHTQSHKTDAASLEGQAKISNWYAQQLAYLLGQLSRIQEGSATLLDNMLVVWGYDMNNGAVHETQPGIAVLAGGLGGKVRTGSNGRLLDLGTYDWNQLLATICLAMGTDIAQVGDLGKGGPIAGLLNA
jgi:hypothetical protein